MVLQSNIDADVIEIAGHEQDFEVRKNQMQATRQFPSIHGRHDHVGQQEVELAAFLSGDQTGFDAVFGFDDMVSDFGQLVANEVPHELLVFHHQYSFAAASNFLMMVVGLPGGCFRIDSREKDVEGRAMSHLAPDINAASAHCRAVIQSLLIRLLLVGRNKDRQTSRVGRSCDSAR